jgi:hypothetical protein
VAFVDKVWVIQQVKRADAEVITQPTTGTYGTIHIIAWKHELVVPFSGECAA